MINNDFKIIKWNIYNAKVPFTVDFHKSKLRPIIVLTLVGDDVIILPISSVTRKKNIYDVIINLDKPGLIKVANIQSINQNDIISPFYSLKTNRIFKLKNEQKQLIKDNLKQLLLN